MNKVLSQSKLFFKRNGSTILTSAGAVGVVTTSVLAVKATPKAMMLLKEAKKEKGEELTTAEKAKTVAPAYIPTAISAVATIACIFGANVLNKPKQASLMSAYALLDNSYKEYRAKVVDLYGDDANNVINESIAKDKYEKTDVNENEVLFYDAFSKRYFTSSLVTVSRAEYCINRDINMRGWAELNEFYDYLDIDPIEGGDALGWSEGGNLARYWQGWVDFNHSKNMMDDGTEYIVISLFQEPYMCYEDDC